jgi:hypothetical protein
MKSRPGHDQIEAGIWEPPLVEIGDNHFSMFES